LTSLLSGGLIRPQEKLARKNGRSEGSRGR